MATAAHTTASPEPRIVGPASGRMLPTLILRRPSGAEVPLWSYRGRRALILLLHRGEADRSWLARFTPFLPDAQEVDGEIVAVGPTDVPDLPFQRLLDPGHRLAAALDLAAPAIVVTDRPGEIWAAWGDGTAEHLPSPEETLDWLRYADSECRECFCCEIDWLAAPA